MEIGNQIKALRLRRGITQEALARQLDVTPQAVSKWERGTATPDIGMLPDISAFFGVTIDELFALSDDTRMERIRNMLWDQRVLPQPDAEAAREFLLSKANREPTNGAPHALLAELENHVARHHHDLAAEYAKAALERDHTLKDAHSNLTEAMNGSCGDWCATNHNTLIAYYQDFVAGHPDYVPGYLWLLDQLLVDRRLDEAAHYCSLLAQYDHSYRTPLYRGLLALEQGDPKGATEILMDMERQFPEEWIMYLALGDFMVRIGEYDRAVEYYRKYTQFQKPRRYTDGLSSIAQLCEIRGDYAGAIAAAQEEIQVLATDWDTTAGEMVEQHLRAISRLEQKMKNG